MTMRGQVQLTPEERKIAARLVQLHAVTHPKRLERYFGVKGKYLQRIWAEIPLSEQAALADSIAFLLKHGI